MYKLSVVKCIVFLELYPAIRYNLLFAKNKRISLYQASSPVVSGLYKFIKVYNTSILTLFIIFVLKMISPRNPARNNCVPKTIVVKTKPRIIRYQTVAHIIIHVYNFEIPTSKHKSYNEHQGSHGAKRCIGLFQNEKGTKW
jgi:hypothetical protein